MKDTVRKIQHYIKAGERKGYPEGIPDEAPAELEEFGKVPSYRLICIALMKNDKQLQTLGFTRPSCQTYLELKHLELQAKGKTVRPRQGRLF